ncbi:MAG: lamin tail domain-containing protein, partial [Verrucomicrobia bacterium]
MAATGLWAGSQVRIAELMPRDEALLADEEGDFSGWIELHNAGSAAVNLAGWALSVDPEQPAQWTLAERWLEPG